MKAQNRPYDPCLFPKRTIQYQDNPSPCPDQKHWRSWSRMVLWKHTRPFRTTTQKRCPFHYRGMECKSRKSRNPGVTGKFGLGVWNAAGQRLIEFCQENSLVIANILFQQHKRRLYTWTISRWSMSKSDWLYSFPLKMELYTVSKNKTRTWLWLRSWTPYCQIQT